MSFNNKREANNIDVKKNLTSLMTYLNFAEYLLAAKWFKSE